LINV